MSFNPAYEKALSTPRFDAYRQRARNDDDLAWALYRWNQDLVSTANSLGADLEVTLRNTIDFHLARHFGRPDWWASPTLVLDQNTDKAIGSKSTKYQSAIASGAAGPGRVISDLMFGTWVNLLSTGGKTASGKRVDYEMNLWRPAISAGFTTGVKKDGTPRRPTRVDVHKRASNFKALRNRMAHHEPIIDGAAPPGGNRLALLQIWDQGLDLLTWMCPELGDHHRSANTLPALYSQRPG